MIQLFADGDGVESPEIRAQAIGALGAVIEADPSWGLAYAMRANLRFLSKDGEGTRADAERALERLETGEVAEVVQLLFPSSEQPRRHEIVEKAMALADPSERVDLRELAALTYEVDGDHARALEEIRGVIQASATLAEPEPPIVLGLRHQTEGRLLAALGRQPEADAAFAQARALAPASALSC